MQLCFTPWSTFDLQKLVLDLDEEQERLAEIQKECADKMQVAERQLVSTCSAHLQRYID